MDDLTPPELERTLAHEVLHCALGHQCRRGGRDPELWNRAADFAINPLLIANGFTLPAGALIDPAFENLSAEEIYARLLKEGSATGQNEAAQHSHGGAGGSSRPPGAHGAPATEPTNGSDLKSDPQQRNSPSNEGSKGTPARPGGFGEVWDATDEAGSAASPAGMRRQEHEWAIATEQALRAAKSCGSEPARVERPLTESRQSQQNWRAILRDFVAATAPADYRWAPPNRRYVAAGLYCRPLNAWASARLSSPWTRQVRSAHRS